MPAVLNAANEVAVEVFLAGRIPFTAIPVMIEDVMKSTERQNVPDLESVLLADLQARATAREWLTCNTGRIQEGQYPHSVPDSKTDNPHTF